MTASRNDSFRQLARGLVLALTAAFTVLTPGAARADSAWSQQGTELHLSSAFQTDVVEAEGLHHVVRFDFDGGELLIRLVDDADLLVDETPLPQGLNTVVIDGAAHDDHVRVEGHPPAGLAFRMTGGDGDDVLCGAGGIDTVVGGDGDDVLFGDYCEVTTEAGSGDLVTARSTRLNAGGADVVDGGAGDDVVVGGARGDTLDGGHGDDLLLGDAVELHRGADPTSPRFQTLAGSMLYARSDRPAASMGQESGRLLTDGTARQQRGAGMAVPGWAGLEIVALHHSFAIEAGIDPIAGPASYGADRIAGGPGDDVAFGQLGNDVIQGDGSATGPAGDLVSASRDSSGLLALTPTLEAASDGDDYIEGGGGGDVVFGGLGQDDLIGGSSSLFSLVSPNLRPDGADLLFGGAGTRIDRHSVADDLTARHARDADAIVGDNGDIIRIVGTNGVDTGGYVAWNHDLFGDTADGYGPIRVVPRGVRLVDYTPGGPDARPDLFGQTPVGCGRDIGGGDLVHGESGDDVVYGGCGGDSLFGDAEDDDLIGNWGADWVSGGTGADGVLGDDGRLFTARNSSVYGEPLVGIEPVVEGDVDRWVESRDRAHAATIYPAGELRKVADLTPFELAPEDAEADHQPAHAHDIVFGGLGDDWLHGGAGNDAISGAEALATSFGQTFDSAGTATGTVAIDYAHPVNPGDPLRIESNESVFNRGTARSTVLVEADGTAATDGTGLPWFLVVDALDPNAPVVDVAAGVRSDGDDQLFGDLGADWLVGGTGRDSLWSGLGDDRADADDDPGTNGGANRDPDDHPSYADLVFGGGGNDTLVGNGAEDRLIDWTGHRQPGGSRDTFVLPDGVRHTNPTVRDHFTPAGHGNGKAAPPQSGQRPSLEDLLYLLSAAQGADPTRASEATADPARNGEPHGEIGAARPWEE